MAIRTRGASAWVRKTPTGLPDCTSSVSSPSSSRERGDDAVEALPVARGAADAAIDDELAGPLGNVRIEIVHQHPQRRFGQPALGVELRAARRPNDADVSVDWRHDFVLDRSAVRSERSSKIVGDRRGRALRSRPIRSRRSISGAR